MQLAKQNISSRPVAIWLLVGVAMIMIQVLLGGITRLTGSGLSITEWKPILGTIPPLNEQDWLKAFDQYKQIGQYKHINFSFTLEDFKFIYFWEWLHRVWARLIGVVFIIPFIIFLVKRRFKKEMIYPMIILFLLGILQARLGWIMVKSGLNDENIYVSHIRLAIHFIAALGLLCYTLWFALKLLVPSTHFIVQPPLQKFTAWITAALVIQLIYGAFMAGLKAAVFAPTWPTINGMWWPEGMGSIINGPIAVQFIHRGLAYVLTVLIFIWWHKAGKIPGSGIFIKTRFIPLLLVLLQVLLGVFTVVYSPDKEKLLWLGVSHQFVAMLLLLSFTQMLYLIRKRQVSG
ncbi:MAG: COX15/CtaA family protein [Chitinophagaceae bacterium]|nr:COX15/CtaA family protein [Chitinophagaceae bacterium]